MGIDHSTTRKLYVRWSYIVYAGILIDFLLCCNNNWIHNNIISKKILMYERVAKRNGNYFSKPMFNFCTKILYVYILSLDIFVQTKHFLYSSLTMAESSCFVFTWRHECYQIWVLTYLPSCVEIKKYHRARSCK